MAAQARSGRKLASPAHKRRTADATDVTLAICHEIGNLLAAMRLSAHLLTRDLKAGASSAPQDIEGLAAQAGSLLAQVRPLLRPTRGPLRVSSRQVLEGLRRALDERNGRGVPIEIHESGDLPDVAMDADALHHALVLLVLAAVEPPASQCGLKASARRAGSFVLFRIDCAVPHAKSGRASGPRGRALAFEILRDIMKRHGGDLRVRLEGANMEATLRVPAARSARGATGSPKAPRARRKSPSR